jgi:hypothetical protein
VSAAQEEAVEQLRQTREQADAAVAEANLAAQEAWSQAAAGQQQGRARIQQKVGSAFALGIRGPATADIEQRISYWQVRPVLNVDRRCRPG